MEGIPFSTLVSVTLSLSLAKVTFSLEPAHALYEASVLKQLKALEAVKEQEMARRIAELSAAKTAEAEARIAEIQASARRWRDVGLVGSCLYYGAHHKKHI